jgi:SHS2 domain-containing protein
MEPLRRFEVLSHTADTGIIAYGSTLPEVFEHAAYGMFSLMFDLDGVPSPVSRPILAAADTVEELLVAWLGEILAVAEIEDLAFSSFIVDRLEEGGVQGAAAGVPAGEASLVGPPIKAVTFHDLAVVEIPEGWWARIIFDV